VWHRLQVLQHWRATLQVLSTQESKQVQSQALQWQRLGRQVSLPAWRLAWLAL
jgi:hypothetical protein